MSHPILRAPFDAGAILRKRKALRRELLADGRTRLKKRVAVLGGSTTNEIVHVLELFLLDAGLEPTFWESDYGRFFEDGAFGSPELDAFRPDIVWLHTTQHNVLVAPSVGDVPPAIERSLQAELGRFRQVWDGLEARYGCAIVQNNFEPPPWRPLGTLDGIDAHGRSAFLSRLNLAFAEESWTRRALHIHDLAYLASWYGLKNWHDHTHWCAYKYALAHDAIPWLAHSVGRVVRAIYGLAKKCLVVDLDNTLWGGVIGDDGLDGLALGPGSPTGEAHSALQAYVRELARRGIAVAVCSKNDPAIAREGFTHPDTLLQLEDFAAFRASWDPKGAVVLAIAEELNIGVDSLVFLDDNPVEREAVRQAAPSVEVIQLGESAAEFVAQLDVAGWFDTVALASEDLERTAMFRDNARRADVERNAASFEEFLASLEMKAEIGPFSSTVIERVTQLINKTNQFNLTTRRYTSAEVTAMVEKGELVTLRARLKDKFGDNGLISVVIAEQKAEILHVDTWLMSCRVLKRGMEEALFDELVRQCQHRKIRSVIGYYSRTKKNGMVAGFYESLGFARIGGDDDASTWRFDLPEAYPPKNRFIEVIRDE
jgi:FkbH-like protein